ncbi:MAG: serine/threonine-protein kinase [Phycisphaerae bacterium]|jgi:tetratricopeptide (TPR) repeat protein
MWPDAAGTDVTLDDEGLASNLRRAFALQQDALRTPGPCVLHSRPGSSAAAGLGMTDPGLTAGARLDEFEILGELGRGGMGVVYRARQVPLGREVALKVLALGGPRARCAAERFRVEAQAAARLHHTNIVSIYGQGESAGRFYYAMELVEGVGLDEVVHEHPELLAASPRRDGEPWSRADYRRIASLMAEVADALACAHHQGVIHRDVKPHNLLLDASHRLHLTDFGLARLSDAPHLTAAGEIMGTPAYLSPEQARGDGLHVDHRTDIYALGVTLYEVLTRRKPYDGRTREEILSAICAGPPLLPRRIDAQIPAPLETICLKAMEREPEQRYADAAELAEDLRRYARGWPIRARRPSRLRRAVLWANRHRALTTAAGVALAACLVCAGLGWRASAARHREGDRLALDAYSRLAYVDYRSPQLVTDDLAQAAALGASAPELDLAEALAALGRNDSRAAVDLLETAVARRPEDLRARYLLSWALARGENHAAARAAFAEAERLGPPTTGDAWFFRGLAVHFDDPLKAIESYRRANTAQARVYGLFPQAVLHLARARNQQMYAARSLESFTEAVDSLRQLVEHEQYGAYPYYLLSISHRLAAEIYAGSEGTRDDALVADHYEAALAWAQRGQKVAPDDDRPITAEAECLESMGRFEEAIAVRTRALAAAAADIRRWECYHFRWRLYYWVGEWQAALDDLAAAAEFDPSCPFYAHVYPALVLAEMGDMPAALVHARALADEAPTSAAAVLWSATCLRLLGHSTEAEDLLAARAEAVDYATGLEPPQTAEWMHTLYACCRATSTPEELDALAAGVEASWKLRGEGSFHLAALYLAQGDRATAWRQFGRAYRAFDGERRYTYHARTILNRMVHDPSWPAWPVDGGASGSADGAAGSARPNTSPGNDVVEEEP